MDTKALDVMRMDVIITPSEVWKILKMVFSWPVISFILLLPYFALRQSTAGKQQGS